ncbi:MAG: SDR family NAD(P)-dependent oxidoreductase [Smithellaceae bacterium]|nr:SDR family NAD(P)-dependent oxidoreductase [Smithellaceae bacterium]
MKAVDKKFVVLISGCSSGIGLSLAREFASRGCRVFATARRPDRIAELQHEKMQVAALDVTDQTSIEACVAEVMARAGRIDLLVNNAGYALMGPVIDLSIEDLRLQFETNVIGLIALTQAVAPHMIQQHFGLIVNIASVSGVCATPFAGAYCGTKAAVNLLSDAPRMQLAPFGINVITVQPGRIQSGFGYAAAKKMGRQDRSFYAPVAEDISARAAISQQDAMPADVFSKKLVDRLLQEKIPRLIRIGKESTRLPLIKKLPVNLLDRILIKKFGLEKLKKQRKP